MAHLKVKSIPLTTLDSASLLNTYQPINPLGLPEACFILKIVNGGTTAIDISYDGITDNDVIFASSSESISTPINTLPNARGALFAKGTIVYARGTAGVGSIGIVGYYTNIP